MITGHTTVIAHLGYPTESFTAPKIFNPYFERNGIDAVVVPIGVKAPEYPALLRLLFKASNVHGALVTMPHKATTMKLLDEASVAAKIAGACNAIVRRPDGTLAGDLFDGEGFVRALRRHGFGVEASTALVVGAGGVGSAIAAALAASNVGRLTLTDTRHGAAESLLDRLRRYYPKLDLRTGPADPRGHQLVVNATPLGMKPTDALPIDVDRLSPGTFVGEVVLSQEVTPLVAAARTRGCRTQVGRDMLFEQIPAYLEFFGYPTTSAEALRAGAKL